MTKKEKRFQKITGDEQKTYHFSDIENFLNFYGFEAEANGSHFIFRRNPYPHITIVVHNKKVSRHYVRRAVQILKDHQIIK